MKTKIAVSILLTALTSSKVSAIGVFEPPPFNDQTIFLNNLPDTVQGYFVAAVTLSISFLALQRVIRYIRAGLKNKLTVATEMTWEMHRAEQASQLFEMANWIHSLAPWQVMAHFTWRDKAFKLRDGSEKMCGVSSESARRYYEKFMAKNFPTLSYFYSIEQNPSRDGHHVHALFSDARNLYRKEMWQLWFEKFGRNKVEKVNSKDDVVSYCAKYCTKAYTGRDGAWWNVKLQSHHWSRIQGTQFELRPDSFLDFK